MLGEHCGTPSLVLGINSRRGQENGPYRLLLRAAAIHKKLMGIPCHVHRYPSELEGRSASPWLEDFTVKVVVYVYVHERDMSLLRGVGVEVDSLEALWMALAGAEVGGTGQDRGSFHRNPRSIEKGHSVLTGAPDAQGQMRCASWRLARILTYCRLV